MGDRPTFLSELKRRKVSRTAIGYVVGVGVLWGLAEVAAEALALPDVVLRLVVVLSIAGFPVALVLAWIFDARDVFSGRARWLAGGGSAAVVLVLTGLLLARPWVPRQPPPPDLPVEFEWEQLTFSGLAQEPVFSPDGRWLAYREPDLAGRGGARIMVMDLATRDVVEVHRHDHNVLWPRWSPDGERIAVHSAGAVDHAHGVYVMSRLGSDPRLVHSVERDFWASYAWAPDGTRIAVVREGWLSFVAADGSGPVADSLRLGFIGDDAEGHISDVSWSPGGAHLAVAAYTARLDADRIVVIDLDGAPLDSIVGTGGASAPRWGADGGWLFYKDVQTDAVRRVGFDPGRGLLDATDAAVVTQPGFSADYSVDLAHGRVALARSSTQTSHIHRVELDGRGEAVGTSRAFTTGSALFSAPRLSPDGQLIAYQKSLDSRRFDLFVRPLDDGPERRITRSGRVVRDVSWSPDARWLAYGASTDSGNVVMIAPVGPGTPRRVGARRTGHGGFPRQFAWSPDGSLLLYQMEGFEDFIVLDIESGREAELLGDAGKGEVKFALFSPDGTQVALQVDEVGAPPALWIVRVRDRAMQELLEPAPGAGGVFPLPLAWSSPDTIHVARAGEIVAVAVSSGEARSVGLIPDWCSSDLDVTPDLESLYCDRSEDQEDIWLGQGRGASSRRVRPPT